MKTRSFRGEDEVQCAAVNLPRAKRRGVPQERTMGTVHRVDVLNQGNMTICNQIIKHFVASFVYYFTGCVLCLFQNISVSMTLSVFCTLVNSVV